MFDSFKIQKEKKIQILGNGDIVMVILEKQF